MGYTHYWYRTAEIEKEVFEAIASDFKKLIEPLRLEERVELGNGHGVDEPVVTEEKVVFNGRQGKNEDYESFAFCRVEGVYDEEEYKTEGLQFNFCKTNERPYDLAVQAFLIIAKHHLKEKIVVNSDGFREQWSKAVGIVEKNIGEVDFHLGEYSI